MNPLFPALPENFGALSREELQALIDERLAIIDKILENKNDPTEHADFIGERTGKEVMDELTAGVADIEKLKDALKANAEEEQHYSEGVEELAAKARAGLQAEAAEEEPEPEPEPEGEPEGEPEVSDELAVEAEASGEDAEDESVEEDKVEETEPEVVVAAAGFSRPAPPKPAKDRRPTPDVPQGVGVLRASAGFADIPAGMILDRAGMTEALITAHEANEVQAGARVKVIAASAKINYPVERQLSRSDSEGNGAKIRAVTSPQVIVASGGFCAPYTPIYDLPFIATAARPVKAGLAAFQANRGGIQFPTPLSLADVAEGVGIVLNEDDALGGTFAAKSCVTIDCDPFQLADVDAVYSCVTHGNLGARAWPERVANVADLLGAQHAVVAETNLLDLISTGSTATTDDQKYGAVSTMLDGIIKAAVAYRSRHRMDPNARLRVLLPSVVIGLLQADMIHGQFDRFHAQGEIERLLGLAGVNVSFYLDTPTGAGQVYGAQAAGALANFLTTVVWYIFHEGAWLFLDMGRLDLGIVRDSVLNETNDFQAFMETFEGAAMVGVESIEVTSTVCADGTYAPTASAEC